MYDQFVLKIWLDGEKYFCSSENRKKYGEVFTLQLQSPLVVLNSAEAVYEGFVKKADYLSQRPRPPYNPIYTLTGG